jgi:hypothetical protein
MIIFKLASKLSALKMVAGSWLRVKKASFYIRDVSKSAGKKKSKVGVSLILVIKDEADRVPYFLDYYRKLNVSHFFILDNQSNDDLAEVLSAQPDVSHFIVSQSYQDSRYGVDWINYIARKYCFGKWVLSIDSDELLVYPKSTYKDLNELCKYLDSIGQNKLYTPMIDMYSDKPVMATEYNRGDNPLEKCRYFDSVGYFTVKGGFGNPWVRGGVRMRVFNRESPLESPALNKFALVKWDWSTFYFRGAHTLLPKRKNSIDPDIDKLTGALLHFKFFDDLYRKSVYAVKNSNHYDGSAEYSLYLKEIEKMETPLTFKHSVKYQSVETLVKAGLINNHDW